MRLPIALGGTLLTLWMLGVFESSDPKPSESKPFDRPDAAHTLQNRPWVDKLPKDEGDRVRAFALIKDGRQRNGAWVDGTMFRFSTDVVDWKAKEDLLFVKAKQDGAVRRLKVLRTGCTTKPPFDMCVELKNAGRTERWFSNRDWKIGSATDLGAELGRRLESN